MYQFVHVESYSRSTPKRASTVNKKTGKASAKASGHCVKYIVDEAIREANSIPHIDQPQPPEYVYGAPLEELEAACDAWADSVRDARGHATRKDALCLAAGVVSAPKDITPEAWEAFKRDSVQWLKDKYGATLRTVIAHHDESHPHLHFYCVPELGQRFETVHQGRAAAALVKAEGGVKGLQNQAYKQAMREYQDEFYEAVGIEHGFTRIGPAKRRLTREEWKLEQIQAAAAARAIAAAKEATDLSAAQSAELIEAAKAEAKTIADQALQGADLVEKEARKRGWKAALDAFEQLPWFKRVRKVVARATLQRDVLQEQVQALQIEKRTMREKLRDFFRAGTAYRDELQAVKPRLEQAETALESAQRKAAQADRLREQNERLKDNLEDAKGRIQHLEAVNEALQPVAPEQPENRPKRQLEASSGEGLVI
jgi:hypothetical protein